MIEVQLPLTESQVRKFKINDNISLNGTIVTARDAAHTWLLEKKRDEVAEILKGSVIYHCGPVVKKTNGEWKFVAAGPTTSIREEPYESKVIERYGIRGIIGKGGMGELTAEGLKRFGAVYLHAVGGAASLIAESVVKVKDVFMLEEFGMPEALWVIEVRNFVTVVTMDSAGNSLHKGLMEKSSKIADRLIKDGTKMAN